MSPGGDMVTSQTDLSPGAWNHYAEPAASYTETRDYGSAVLKHLLRMVRRPGSLQPLQREPSEVIKQDLSPSPSHPGNRGSRFKLVSGRAEAKLMYAMMLKKKNRS